MYFSIITDELLSGITKDLSILGPLVPCDKYGNKFLKLYKIRLKHISLNVLKSVPKSLSFIGNPHLIELCVFWLCFLITIPLSLNILKEQIAVTLNNVG